MEKITKCPSSLEEAGRAAGCEGCPGQALCQAQAGSDVNQEALNVRMKAIKHKILVMSGKGGVGKSTVAVCLSACLSRRGKVAVLDTDICGPSLPRLLGVQEAEITSTQWGWKPPRSPAGGIGVVSVGSMLPSADSAVTFRGPRKTQLVRAMLKDTLWGRLDYLVIDTPPGTSDEHLSLAKLLRDTRPDGVVLVTTPQKLACGVVRRQVTFCRRVGLRILGLVENMTSVVCPCCQDTSALWAGEGGTERLCGDLGVPLLGRLPLDPRLVQCCDEGRDFVVTYPESVTARRLLDITDRVVELCQSPGPPE